MQLVKTYTSFFIFVCPHVSPQIGVLGAQPGAFLRERSGLLGSAEAAP